MSIIAWFVIAACITAICFILKFAAEERKEHHNYMTDDSPPGVDDTEENPYEHLFIKRDKLKP